MKQFGFLLHPLGMRDVIRYAPQAARKREALVLKMLEWMRPYEASTIKGVRSAFTGEEIQGKFVMVPLLARQFLQLDRREVLDRVISAALLAQHLGCQLVGLGGYNSVVGGAGREVADALKVGVTSGNSYTVATALEGALEAARVMDVDLRRSTVAVVGATGSIGGVCSRILAREVSRLVLIGRSKSRLQVLAEQIHCESRTALAVERDLECGIQDADVVITATSSGGGIIRPQALKSGAIVCDVAVPHDVCREVAQARRDVLVVEGGLVQVPGDPDFQFDFGYPPGVALACMAETMVLTLEGRFEDYSIGRGLEIERVDTVARMARKHGFRLAGFRAFDEPISRDRLEEVRSLARERRRGLKVIG